MAPKKSLNPWAVKWAFGWIIVPYWSSYAGELTLNPRNYIGIEIPPKLNPNP